MGLVLLIASGLLWITVATLMVMALVRNIELSKATDRVLTVALIASAVLIGVSLVLVKT